MLLKIFDSKGNPTKIKWKATLKNHKEIEHEGDKLNLRYISTKTDKFNNEIMYFKCSSVELIDKISNKLLHILGRAQSSRCANVHG